MVAVILLIPNKPCPMQITSLETNEC